MNCVCKPKSLGIMQEEAYGSRSKSCEPGRGKTMTIQENSNKKSEGAMSGGCSYAADVKQDLSFLAAHAHIYFVGIGGISMSGLAEISAQLGYKAAGSDMHLSQRTHYLQEKGILVFSGHAAANLESFKPDLVVHTAAILPGNPELAFADANGIPSVDRARFLGYLTAGFERVINISGTHGKTTTTSMASLILIASGQEPTVHLGAELDAFGSTVHMGRPHGLLVSEACEYQRSFLQFYSTTAAITNIDYDHVDCFKSLSEVIDVFAEFTKKLSDGGTLVIPAFDPNTAEAVRRMPRYREQMGLSMPRIVTTGLKGDIFAVTGEHADVYADNLNYHGGYPSFDVYIDRTFYVHIDLHIPGDHNVYNALTAIACSHINGGTPEAAAGVLAAFTGAEGRYSIKGKYKGATVVADYAHHPAAARATLAAASHIPHNKTWVVFQPLTFNRTQVLFDDFVQSLLPCEHVLFAEIFSDREINPGTVSSSMLADKINELGGNAEFFADKKDIIPRLNELVHEDDLILVLGPEDIRELADDMIKIEAGQ